MSFNNYARRVKNVDLPMGPRVRALRSCIGMLASLRNESFNQEIKRFDERFHFNWTRGIFSKKPSEGALIATLMAVEAERNAYLEDLRAEALKRKAAKTRRRMPHSHQDM